MLFLANTSINLPKVYAAYKSDATGNFIIIMEFIPGVTLIETFSDLLPAQKDLISLSLRQQVDEMRKLPSPGYFGGMGKRQLPDGVFWPGTKEGDPTISGPFDTESEINNAFIKKTLLIDQTWNKRGPKRAEFYRRMLAGILRNHAPVFTHGDLQRKNIITQAVLAEERDRPLSEVTAFHVTLVDWENAGWYPSYWEYCSASWSFRFDDDWPEYLEKSGRPMASRVSLASPHQK